MVDRFHFYKKKLLNALLFDMLELTKVVKVAKLKVLLNEKNYIILLRRR